MLLYAKTEEEIQPDNVYQMHGSQISVKTLDLNLPLQRLQTRWMELLNRIYWCNKKLIKMRKLFCNLSIPELVPCEIENGTGNYYL